MQKIAILGATGYLGSHLAAHFREQGWEVLDHRIDITDYPTLFAYLAGARPDVVINAAGRTGVPNVDWCETHQEETMLINVAGALNAAIAAHTLGIYFVHIGSGCVYEGDNGGAGFSEDDPPNFFGSFYSRTKALSEQLLKEFHPLQLRIRIPIEGRSHRKNVIDKLLAYDRIISIENSFTIVEDFVPATYALIERREKGIFNMTNSGSMDHEFLMSKYTELVDPARHFSVMPLSDLAKVTVAKRSNCVLDTSKRERLDIPMPDIKTRIIDIMHAYKASLT